MGIANAQRALNYIRIFGEFFSQPEYANLVGILGVMNEPLQSVIGKDSLTSLYVLRSSYPNSLIIAANIMLTRSVATSRRTTYSEGLLVSARVSIFPLETDSLALRTGLVTSPIRIGLFLTLTHTSPSTEGSTMTRSRSPDRTEDPEAFGHNRHVDAGLTNWLTGMSTSIRDPPPETPASLSGSARTAVDTCHFHSQSAFGVTIAGEYSNGFNDCAFWLRGPANLDTLNPNCDFWTNSAAWNDTVKEGLKNFALASMDSLMNPFFWTWKVSLVLKLYFGGELGAIITLSWSRFAIGSSAFTFALKQLPRAPVLAISHLSHTTRPKKKPYHFPSPS